MSKAKVEIYSIKNCPSCVRAKQLFEAKKIEFTEYKVDEDKAKFQEMKERTHNARTVPQIFINDESIGGFDDLLALEKAGKLNEKL